MSNSIIKQVVILGAIAIIGIIGIQSYWVMRTWDLKEEEFHRTVNIALIKVAQDLATFNGIPLPSQDLITRKFSNNYIVNINNVFDTDILEYYLLNTFEAYALDTDFEYAIYDCSSDEMVGGDFCKVTDSPHKPDVPLGFLPKEEDFTYYFGVKFPSRNSYLLEQMQLSILFSIILFVAILFFIYSIFVILRQKAFDRNAKGFYKQHDP